VAFGGQTPPEGLEIEIPFPLQLVILQFFQLQRSSNLPAAQLAPQPEPPQIVQGAFMFSARAEAYSELLPQDSLKKRQSIVIDS